MHYIINKIEEDGETPRYKIGSNFFESMPTLLRHYTTHYLDTTQLLRPVTIRIGARRNAMPATAISLALQTEHVIGKP